MTLVNGAIKEAMECMGALCAPTNRLPIVASLAADRALRDIVAENALFEPRRAQYIQDHGTEIEGGWQILPSSDGWAGYMEIMEAESGLDIKPLNMADIEMGYSKGEDGKKGLLDISSTQLGALRELGLIVSPTEE